MGFLSNLFKKGEDPLPTCDDSTLGKMNWSEDDEAWEGQYQGMKFSLAYERTKTPDDMVSAYARELLGDKPWLEATLEKAKQAALEEYSASSHEEIKSLRWGLIHFYLHKGVRRIIADLDGGQDYRAWRIEFRERECEGIGFDS